MTTFNFPFPPAILNPNNNAHWRKKAKAKKSYRWACAMIARECRVKFSGRLVVRITFHEPDKRGRDKDNMIAAFKAGQDGLADAIGVDDALFNTNHHIGDPVKDGAVVVVVRREIEDVPIIGTINVDDVPVGAGAL